MPRETGEIRGRGLSELVSVSADHVIPGLAECEFKVACDVTNVLCGEQGSSAVYGRRRGYAIYDHPDG